MVRLLHCRGPFDAGDRQATRRSPRASGKDAATGPAHRRPDEPHHRDAEHGPRAKSRQTDVPCRDRDARHATRGSCREPGRLDAPGRGKARARALQYPVRLREDHDGSRGEVPLRWMWMAHVAPVKKRLVGDLASRCAQAQGVGIVNIPGVPAPQVQSIPKKLWGRATITGAKKNLLRVPLGTADPKKTALLEPW